MGRSSWASPSSKPECWLTWSCMGAVSMLCLEDSISQDSSTFCSYYILLTLPPTFQSVPWAVAGAEWVLILMPHLGQSIQQSHILSTLTIYTAQYWLLSTADKSLSERSDNVWVKYTYVEGSLISPFSKTTVVGSPVMPVNFAGTASN